MTTSPEQKIHIEAVRTPLVRQQHSKLSYLGFSIRDEGMRHPITLWKDGTIISGQRRHRACLLMGRADISAVLVDTIEDAAKRLLIDSEDDHHALPLKWSEVCRLWEVLRRLDAPAAVARADAARRRGVELRRQTYKGARKAGRSRNNSEDYVLGVLAPAFGTSESTARRLWAIYAMAFDLHVTATPDNKREQAQHALADIDAGESSISANYERLVSGRRAPVSRPRPPAAVVESAATRTQLAAWDRSLPQMEGLVAGLIELGPPNTELTWNEVGPVHARLKVVRRDLEKIINKMKENAQS